MAAFERWQILAMMHQFKLLLYFGGITVCFCLYSLIQERLMTVGFGPEGERFRHSIFVIFVNRIVTMAVAAAVLALTEQSLKPAAPMWLFSVPSFSNVLASAAQYEALKYVSFPLQALAKCAKTVPVMVWGVFVGTKYSSQDYLCSAAVTAGCAIFVLTGNIAAPAMSRTASAAAESAGTAEPGAGGDLGGSEYWAVAGMFLLAAFLIFDGLASTSQDRLFSSYTMHSCNQLLWVTTWSAAFSFALLAVTGQVYSAFAFVLRHPSSLWLILALSVLSTAAQLFIFFTIQQYGALQFALVMTVRQFLSIVLSCLVFAHHLSLAQWAGTALVILALAHRAQSNSKSKIQKPALSDDGKGEASEAERSVVIPVIRVETPGKQQHGLGARYLIPVSANGLEEGHGGSEVHAGPDLVLQSAGSTALVAPESPSQTGRSGEGLESPTRASPAAARPPAVRSPGVGSS